MPPSLFSPYPLRVGTQILLTDLHYARRRVSLCINNQLSHRLLGMSWRKRVHSLPDSIPYWRTVMNTAS